MPLIPVVDVFAGPGGLGEGFSAVRVGGRAAFQVVLSIEKDRHACATLEMRSFFRQFADRRVPKAYYEHLRGVLTRAELYKRFPVEAQRANEEAWHAELGSTATSCDAVHHRIRHALHRAKGWVLIGGPPCQAYSVAGRSRNRGVRGYRPEADERHRLYEEYLRIVTDHWPPVFVMENVKGLLSATIRDELLFERMCKDLGDPARSMRPRRRHRYRILSLEEVPERSRSDGESVGRFVVRAERHGIPQCRHRVYRKVC
ncbi:MAG: DNA cytosine methyltransferase [bacterium]